MLDILELRYINNCEKIVVFLKFERIKKKKYSFLLLLVFFKTWCILLQVFPPSYVKGFRIKKTLIPKQAFASQAEGWVFISQPRQA